MIKVVTDSKRGCGWRKPGGTYLIAGGVAMPCGKLPLPLKTCPCCGAGVKPARGWTWVDGDALFGKVTCAQAAHRCERCPLHANIGRAGLLWIGESFYKTPEDWLKESEQLGISRRIKSVPKGFELGRTLVLVAHRKAIKEPCPQCQGKADKEHPCEACANKGVVYTPAIFQVFRPTEIQYVVTGKETPEELARIEKRGIQPVRIERNSHDPLFEQSGLLGQGSAAQ